MADPVVGVIGAKALRRDLKQLTDDMTSPLWTDLEAAGIQAVAPVADATRSSLPTDDAAKKAGALRDSVRVVSYKSGAGVRMGSAGVNWAGWVEFGGSRPDGSSREYIKDGRYLFPAARSLGPRAAEFYSAAIERVVNEARVWTNTTTDGSAVHD